MWLKQYLRIVNHPQNHHFDVRFHQNYRYIDLKPKRETGVVNQLREVWGTTL